MRSLRKKDFGRSEEPLSAQQPSSVGSKLWRRHDVGGEPVSRSIRQHITASGLQLSEDQVTEVRETFELYDASENGIIEAKDLRNAMRSLGFNPTKEEIRRLLFDVDVGADGGVDLANFLKIMTVLMGEREAREEMLRAFAMYDEDDTGKITFANIKRVAEQVGEPLTDEEIMEMIREADKDGDGEVNLNEFLGVMKRTELW